jgi:O-antigen/teichoic acid export membrane protein
MAFFANACTMVVSATVILLLPRLFGDDFVGFGWCQVFLFYVTYVGFAHLGWCDGFYLREGGVAYDELDKSLVGGQVRALALSTSIAAIVVALGVVAFTQDADSRFVVLFVALNAVLVIPQTLLSYALQVTNRIGAYSISLIGARGFYGGGVLVAFILGVKDYHLFIAIYTMSSFVMLIVVSIICRDVVLDFAATLRQSFAEGWVNIKVGVHLLMSNLAVGLIDGVTRFAIQLRWSIAVFGKVSLALNIATMVTSLTGSASVVLYPALKRSGSHDTRAMYRVIDAALMIPLFGLLCFYYPGFMLVAAWLPQYKDGLTYLVFLFPAFLFSAKATVVIGTVMKVARMERSLAVINLGSLMVAVVLTLLAVGLMGSLLLAIVSVLITSLMRALAAHVALIRRAQRGAMLKSIGGELVLTAVFCIFTWCYPGHWAWIAYVACYVLCLLWRRHDINAVRHALAGHS